MKPLIQFCAFGSLGLVILNVILEQYGEAFAWWNAFVGWICYGLEERKVRDLTQNQ